MEPVFFFLSLSAVHTLPFFPPVRMNCDEIDTWVGFFPSFLFEERGCVFSTILESGIYFVLANGFPGGG